jgi:hypothetical protein
MPDTLDDLLTLKDAARLIPRATEATLRAERDRGRLVTYKIGRRFYTTERDVREMIELCRVQESHPASTSTRTEARGASATDRARSAQDALERTLRAPSKSFGTTSPTSTSRRQADASARARS